MVVVVAFFILCLRFIDRSERQVQLRSRIADLEIPKCCYLALGNSTHTWSSVMRALPQEVHAFSTKARCPALLLFEMRDNIDGLDVATFLGSEALGEMYEDETTTESMEVMVGHSDADHPARSFFRSFDGEMSRTRRASVSAIISSQNGHSSASVGDAADNALIASHRLSEEAMQVEQIASPEDVLVVSPKADASSGQGDSGDGEDEGEDQDCIPEEDMESFASKTIRLKEASPLGSTPGWRLDGLIAKSNDDLRQEVCACILIIALHLVSVDGFGAGVCYATHFFLRANIQSSQCSCVAVILSYRQYVKEHGPDSAYPRCNLPRWTQER